MELIKVIIGVVFGVSLSVLMIAKPEVLWKIEHCLSTSKDGEPSDLYISLMRVGGALLLGVFFILFIVLLVRFVVL